MNNKKCFISKVSKGNIFTFVNLVFCLGDFRANVPEFSILQDFFVIEGYCKIQTDFANVFSPCAIFLLNFFVIK